MLGIFEGKFIEILRISKVRLAFFGNFYISMCLVCVGFLVVKFVPSNKSVPYFYHQ